jgi:YesN/AraC family two-component response regulator
MIRVIVADDQRAVREGLATLVGLLDGIEVVGSASDGAEAVELARRERPDVVLMDLRMPSLTAPPRQHGSARSFPKRRCSC